MGAMINTYSMQDSKNILLVEDDEDDQAFFREAINEIDNAVLYDIARDGKEAVDRLANAIILPDLIFMDINMPRMNGIDCLKQLASNPHTYNIPVVMLTTSTNERALAIELGARDYIKKPSTYGLLRDCLQRTIDIDFEIGRQLVDQVSFSPLQLTA
jgi:CheY-like chemotaxis protein